MLIAIITKKISYKNIEGYELCPGVKIIATPGHTAEDVTVLVESIRDGKTMVFAITGIHRSQFFLFYA